MRLLSQGAAITLVGALAAGCSSNAVRFQDMVPTASTNAQTQYAAAPAQAGVDYTATGSVSRHPVPRGDVARGQAAAMQQVPVAQQPYPGESSYPPAPAAQPIQSASLPPVSAAPATPAPVVAAAPARPATTTSTFGGTTITIAQGDTIYGLSRRHGVPVNDILQANGLSGQPTLVAGRKLIIPGGASAPNVVAAAPVRADDANRPTGGTPVPAARQEPVATLPKAKPEPVAAAPAQPSGGGDGTYTVASGDSLYSIARKLGTTSEALKQANGLADGYLRIGQKLKVPGAAPARTQVASAPAKVDPVVTSTAAAPKPEVASYTPPKAEKKQVEQVALDKSGDAPTATGIGKMRWPVRGRVVSSFGQTSGGKSNDGIDISVPEGTSVRAAENGVVIYAGDGLKEFGNTVLVRHEDGTVTVYGHASKLNVSRGEQVKRGQEIALSGTSGQTDTPKLHFEVRKNSAPVDPTGFLE